MSFYQLPLIRDTIDFSELCFKSDKIKKCENILNYTLYIYLIKIKNQIDFCIEDWENIKKFSNPYEFIHTVIPGHKYSISKYKPLSRSYFKLVEILGMFNLLNGFDSTPLSSFHLCEGPGGFIEAMVNLRENVDDTYYGMTLVNKTAQIPGWTKAKDFLSSNKNVVIEKGKDKTGDITKSENLEWCYQKYKGTQDLITADGGFDFSVDFINQEVSALRLIFSQVAYATLMQKVNGSFVLKVFDIFYRATSHILYLLSLCYEKVYIVKPNTSRYGNSERYIVCKNLKIIDQDKLFRYYSYCFAQYSNNPDLIISELFSYNVPLYYISRLEEVNAILGQQQIENINTTINLIKHSDQENKLEILKRNNIQKCISWCIKYNVSYIKNISITNIFMD